MAQLDMFADESPAQANAAAERMRRKLDLLLAEANDAGAHGLPQARRRLMETIVPQMTRWLPDEEAEQVRRAFCEALAN